MASKKLVDATWLLNQVVNNVVNKKGVRILDCAYKFPVPPKPDVTEFMSKDYGQWDRLMDKSRSSEHYATYLSEHIPGALHADLDIAMYPTKTQRFGLYPPEMFEEYVRRLGVDKDDHIILYDRGAMGGMLFAAKFWWLFKTYGHDNVSLLNGGLMHAWKPNKMPLTKEVPKLPKGNWEAKYKKELNVTFDELTQKNNGKELIEQPHTVNFLDARVRGQFTGKDNTGFNETVPGSYIPGFKNVPGIEMVNSEGLMKSADEIKKLLLSEGFDENQATITNCNLGLQATLLNFGLSLINDNYDVRMYNGSLKEVEMLDPGRISATG